MQHDPNDLRRASAIFKTLSHPSRLRIACELINGRVCTQKELVEEFGWPQSTMARHLAMLRDIGLIEATRRGQEITLKLSGPVARELMAAVCQWVHPETGEAFNTDPSEFEQEQAS